MCLHLELFYFDKMPRRSIQDKTLDLVVKPCAKSFMSWNTAPLHLPLLPTHNPPPLSIPPPAPFPPPPPPPATGSRISYKSVNERRPPYSQRHKPTKGDFQRAGPSRPPPHSSQRSNPATTAVPAHECICPRPSTPTALFFRRCGILKGPPRCHCPRPRVGALPKESKSFPVVAPAPVNPGSLVRACRSRPSRGDGSKVPPIPFPGNPFSPPPPVLVRQITKFFFYVGQNGIRSPPVPPTEKCRAAVTRQQSRTEISAVGHGARVFRDGWNFGT